MYRNIGRRQSSWEGDGPRKIGWPPVIVANEKTSDTADRMPDGERRCGGCESRHNWNTSPVQRPYARADAPQQPPEPAQPAAAEQQRQKRRLVAKFNRPDELGANESTDDADQCGVHAACRQTAAQELAVEDPQSGE